MARFDCNQVGTGCPADEPDVRGAGTEGRISSAPAEAKATPLDFFRLGYVCTEETYTPRRRLVEVVM